MLYDPCLNVLCKIPEILKRMCLHDIRQTTPPVCLVHLLTSL